MTSQRIPGQASSANSSAPTSIILSWQDMLGNWYSSSPTVTPWGQIRIQQDPTQLFLDTFDAGLDTTNRWKTPTTGGTGIAATSTVGATVLDGGTTANSFSMLESVASFIPDEPGWDMVSMRVNIEFPVVTTAYRMWGLATNPGSPTIAAPVTNSVAFAIRTDGKLYAETYASGTLNFSADLSVATGNGTQPQNSSAHKYYIFVRGDQTYWAIDSIDNIVASFGTGASGPDVNTLPLKFLVVSNAGTHATIQVNGLSVGDTARNNMTLSDSVYPWRQQTIYPSGSAYFGLVNNEGQRATYRYTVLGFTPVATPTAFVVIQGSATKVVRIKRIYVSGVATAAGNMPLVATRRSTAGTLGSAVLTAITAAKHDTSDGAATAVVSTVGTANYTTLGTANGQLCTSRIGLSAAGTGVADTPALYEFSTRNDKPIILRGTSDFLTLEGNGAAVPGGGVLDIEIETEEDTY